MKDPALNEFFQARKEAWLKKNLKPSMDADETQAKQGECDEIFSPEQWLPNAAKRAGQISVSTHPCTFSHPSSRKNKNGYATSVIAHSVQTNDGFLRSGNVKVDADALGNAAALDVYKFLSLKMADNTELLSHLKRDSDLAVKLLTINSQTYQELKAGFLAMTENDAESITSSKIKQVYFPVDDDYHQLSLLTASGLVFELRKRINAMRFSKETIEARAHKNRDEFHPQGFRQLDSITTIGYGGTKPQNISVLNNQNGGKAHLLLCTPPTLDNRKVQFPTADFFTQSVNVSWYKDIFYALHDLFKKYGNNRDIRKERDDYYQAILGRIIDQMWAVRFVADKQYNPQRSRLNKTQRIWLLKENSERREQEDEWLDELTKTITRFIFGGYEKVLRKKAIMFSDEEFKHIHQQVIKNREALR